MRYEWVVGVVMLAGPAIGQEAATLGGCVVEGGAPGVMPMATCDVTNTSDTPIAVVQYAYRIVEDGRTVPWHEEGHGSRGRPSPVSGGIEPGETAPVLISVFPIPDRAGPSARYEFTLRGALDVNGKPIPAP